MYAPGHYDDGPGPSSFQQRPWSPDYPPPRRSADFYEGPRSYQGHGHSSRRREREPSEISVEALDLADYAYTLRRQGPEHDPYSTPPDPYQRQAGYPPIARPFSAAQAPARPFSAQTMSRQNPFVSPPQSPALSYSPHSPSPPHRPFSGQSLGPAPSLVSGETVTTRSSHDYYANSNPRHMSLPPPASDPSHPSQYGYGRRGAPPPVHSGMFAPGNSGIFAAGPSGNRSRRSLEQPPPSAEEDGIDVRNFPRFARNWYSDPKASKLRDPGGPPVIFPDFDGHPPSASSRYNSPTVVTGSGRDLLPWGAQLDDGTPVSDEIKEERLRMLEREFGPRPSRQRDIEGQPEEEERVIGSVDASGNLITAGPKKRLALRIVQTLLAFGSAAAGIYAALLIHPNPPAPPAGSIPAVVLDVLSVLTFLGLLYILVFRRCCVRNKGAAGQVGGMGMPGMPGGVMVLPVQQGGKKPKKKKHKKGMPMQGDVQVNLIVDPSTFMPPPQRSRRRGGYSELSGDMDSDDDRPAPPRRSVFHGIALEQAWLRARTFTKRLVAFDVVAGVAWIAAFIYASFVGDNCPPGKYAGWCDAYNLSLAGAALIFMCFVASAFFDIRDLRMSSQSPRTRT